MTNWLNQDYGGFQLEFVSISRVKITLPVNKFSALIG